MKQIIQLNKKDRLALFETVAKRMKMQPAIIEKDFWVVWTLWRLFEQKELKPHLTFKGGTSLSKVYGAIKRFSEDIDLSIEKGFFGFDDENSPENAPSRKKCNKALEALSSACSQYVQNDIVKLLTHDFSEQLGNKEEWQIVIGADDPDAQTVLFEYPKTTQSSPYIRQFVKLEMGARSEHWPVSEHGISSYIKDVLGDKIEEPQINIKVLDIERTFWEKATILHAYAHVPKDKKIPERLARHYYDMHCLLQSNIKDKAANDLELLARVVKHKITYFRSSWSNFETAAKGTLKQIPSETLEKHLRADCLAMADMFFEKPPEWDKIMKSIKDFECEFNKV
ncbi:MAG: nucleotidyl transferase AbiEii/AbiGii toxin family protein [bacterium]